MLSLFNTLEFHPREGGGQLKIKINRTISNYEAAAAVIILVSFIAGGCYGITEVYNLGYGDGFSAGWDAGWSAAKTGRATLQPTSAWRVAFMLLLPLLCGIGLALSVSATLWLLAEAAWNFRLSPVFHTLVQDGPYWPVPGRYEIEFS